MVGESAFEEDVVVEGDAIEAWFVKVDPACAAEEFDVVIDVVGEACEDLGGEYPVVGVGAAAGELEVGIKVGGTEAAADVGAEAAGDEVLEADVPGDGDKVEVGAGTERGDVVEGVVVFGPAAFGVEGNAPAAEDPWGVRADAECVNVFLGIDEIAAGASDKELPGCLTLRCGCWFVNGLRGAGEGGHCEEQG